VAAVLVDAGGLIALLDRSDRNHQACIATLGSIADPLLTVWPAVTEAMHLLADTPPGQEALLDMIDDEALAVVELEAADARRMKTQMRKYRDLPMDFADAALVRVAERERVNRIVTFDRQFRIYALPGRARFAVLPAS
jgi:predicted nucleic acid-binding protein